MCRISRTNTRVNDPLPVSRTSRILIPMPPKSLSSFICPSTVKCVVVDVELENPRVVDVALAVILPGPSGVTQLDTSCRKPPHGTVVDRVDHLRKRAQSEVHNILLD